MKNQAQLVTQVGHYFGWVFTGLLCFLLSAYALDRNHSVYLVVSAFFFGCILIGVRCCYVICPYNRSVEKWWRWFRVVPILRFGQWEMSNFTVVQLKVEYRGGDSHDDSRTVHAVTLRGTHTLLVAEKMRYVSARNIALNIARLMKLPFHDKVSGTTQVRRPEDIGISLRERLLRNNTWLSAPVVPDNGLIVESQDSHAVTITLRPQPSSISYIVGSQVASSLVVAVGVFILLYDSVAAGGLVIAIGLLAAATFLKGGVVSRFPVVISISGGFI